MERLFLISAVLWLLAVGGDGAPRADCKSSNCKLPDCNCYGTAIPGGLKLEDTPQLVMLTFDDAITVSNYDYYVKSVFNRQNPNKCNISATFFSTHEYNDYMRTNNLYRQGHEIALHSITHRTGIDYWKHASVEQLEKEFLGQRVILEEFGLIPKNAMNGIRSPFLQNAGDNTFQMLAKNNLTWDCSWPTMESNKNDTPWPYTLDFKSPQDCPIPPCPESAFPGIWEVPMVDWLSGDVPCAMVDTCPTTADEDKLVDFMKNNFHRHYDGNKAPFPFFVHAAWFAALPMRFNAYNKFLDYLGTLKDVYIVSVSQVIEWIKTPTPLSKMGDFWKCWQIPEDKCQPVNCRLRRVDVYEVRYMESCAPCPDVYPWLGNPRGIASTTTEVTTQTTTQSS